MKYADILAERIRRLCRERGVTAFRLTADHGIKQSTLNDLMRGLTKNPRVTTLHKIALAFNMTLAEFLDFAPLNTYSFEDEDDV